MIGIRIKSSHFRKLKISSLYLSLFFKKTWIFLKEYWQIPFVIVWTTITVVLTRRNTEALKEVILIKKESHKKHINMFNSILTYWKLVKNYDPSLFE